MKFRFYLIFDNSVGGTDHQEAARRAAEDPTIIVIDTDGGKILQPDTHVVTDIREQRLFVTLG